MNDKMHKLKRIMGKRGKEEHGSLKVMFFNKWIFSHLEEQMLRMREMPH